MSYVNLLANDVWSESDITNRGRAIIESQVSEARQNELRTIMLGHIAQMRVATPEEMAEIMQVQALTEQAVLDNAAARADMALLAQAQALEAAVSRLAVPLVEVVEAEGDEPNPAVEVDALERAEAQAVVDAASPEVLALYDLRNPTPELVVGEVAQ